MWHIIEKLYLLGIEWRLEDDPTKCWHAKDDQLLSNFEHAAISDRIKHLYIVPSFYLTHPFKVPLKLNLR